MPLYVAGVSPAGCTVIVTVAGVAAALWVAVSHEESLAEENGITDPSVAFMVKTNGAGSGSPTK